MAMDTDPETLDWIQKGMIAGTIAQKPYTMAFVGLQMLDGLHHNKRPLLMRIGQKTALPQSRPLWTLELR